MILSLKMFWYIVVFVFKEYYLQVTHDFCGVYVCDLGIANMLNSVQTTTTSKGKGTPVYMAPEMYMVSSFRGTFTPLVAF